MNAIEEEVIILNCVLEATQDLLSGWLITPLPPKDGVIIQIAPKDMLEKRLFAILLLDLISPLDTGLFPGAHKTAVEKLMDIGLNPQVGGKQLGKRVSKAAKAFQVWLDKEFEYDFDSSVQKRIQVKFTRHEVLKFCGNYKKHFGYRLGAVLQKMSKIYTKAGVQISGDESLVLLEDIENWLYEDVFAYHFTKICEHLSEINNSILAYLAAVHKKRFKQIDDTFYKFSMPRSIKSRIGRSQFYQLLNRIRSRHRHTEPVIKTDKYLSLRY
jgi:hypothetical protein